eukprot:CAMPEP_0203862262 /NCGR_PEP_ID=MMETSP0359-20131031/13488_1 /ASSEMBLY_ACC=CAM_ASM_000338 /TAXON_ID=268821 /ORGANISM="Scrippsiella Hangoei, Strain SHTV-5" /LENGTH=87 /DNA_ID=CAMNT_0050779625 /DNA_START=57 /DNA_END=316 /DNA_ORIENTATION=+
MALIHAIVHDLSADALRALREAAAAQSPDWPSAVCVETRATWMQYEISGGQRHDQHTTLSWQRSRGSYPWQMKQSPGPSSSTTASRT